MPFKKSTGNMYDWVTHTHSHLGGECPHKCIYCYVQRNRFGVNQRYKGNLRLIDSELQVDYGSGNIIFIEHMNDLFGFEVTSDWIMDILFHCRAYQNNTYVFQSKDPERAYLYREQFPNASMVGTTIETNRSTPGISKAPKPIERFYGIKKLREFGMSVFITVEPIMDFDLDILSRWIIDIKPEFVNIGADSKGCSLSEPSAEKILKLIDILNKNHVIIKKKINLERIFK